MVQGDGTADDALFFRPLNCGRFVLQRDAGMYTSLGLRILRGKGIRHVFRPA